MKTFRELISWELEQEKKHAHGLFCRPEESAAKLEARIMRKVKYLSSVGSGATAQPIPVKSV